MPIVKIEIVKGYSKEYKKILLDTVHEALVKVLQLDEGDRFQRLYELEDESYERTEFKTKQFTLIELTLFPGRTKETKKDIIVEITKLLGERLGVPSTDVFIIVLEPPLENWGIAGKQLGEK